MRRIYLFIIFFGCYIFGYSQEKKSQIDSSVKRDIYFEDFNVYIVPNDVMPDTHVVKTQQFDSLVIILENNLGKSKYEAYNNHKLLRRGLYNSSLGTLCKYSYKEDIMTGEGSYYLHYYYQPIIIRTSIEKFEN